MRTSLYRKTTALFTNTVSNQNTMVQITNSVKLVLTGLTFVVAALCLPVQGNAQRVEDYLRKADLNDDGKIEPSETTMPLRRYLIGKGYDTRESHQIADIVRKTSESKSSKTAPKGKGELKVPKFGVDPKEKKNVGAFGVTAGKPVEYSEAVTSRTQSTFDRYDVNSNGTLEGSEITNVPWGSPRPSASDKNGDGRLSFQEIQERFRERENALQRSGRSSSDADQGRGRSNSGWRGRFNRSSDSPGSSRGRFRGSRDDEDEDDDDEERSSRKNSRSASYGGRSNGRSNVNDERQRRERAEKYVEDYFEKNDLDKNGVLEGDELKRVTKSSKSKYDKDRNGKITKAEVLAAQYPPKSITTTKSSSNRNPRSSKPRTYTKNSSAFNKADANKDRLVQMHEFSKTWTQKKLDEFLDKDANGDGVISPEEW